MFLTNTLSTDFTCFRIVLDEFSSVNCLLLCFSSARGWFLWWVECLKRSLSAGGVAVFVSGVNMWTLSVVPVAFHCATRQVCWWHVSVTKGVSGGF